MAAHSAFWRTALLLSLVACGTTGKKNAASPAAPNPGNDPGPGKVAPPPNGDDGKKDGGIVPGVTWYGIAQKCLIGAEEKKLALKDGSPAFVLSEKLSCSPKLSASTLADLTKQLDAWRKTNCPATVAISGTDADASGTYKNALVRGDRSEDHTSTDSASIDQALADKETCVGVDGKAYGSVVYGEGTPGSTPTVPTGDGTATPPAASDPRSLVGKSLVFTQALVASAEQMSAQTIDRQPGYSVQAENGVLIGNDAAHPFNVAQCTLYFTGITVSAGSNTTLIKANTSFKVESEMSSNGYGFLALVGSGAPAQNFTMLCSVVVVAPTQQTPTVADISKALGALAVFQ